MTRTKSPRKKPAPIRSGFFISSARKFACDGPSARFLRIPSAPSARFFRPGFSARFSPPARNFPTRYALFAPERPLSRVFYSNGYFIHPRGFSRSGRDFWRFWGHLRRPCKIIRPFRFGRSRQSRSGACLPARFLAEQPDQEPSLSGISARFPPGCRFRTDPF